MAAASVLLIIHAPTVPIVAERRLPSDVPLTQVQGRLELLCGIPPAAQRLSLWSARTDDKDGNKASLIARWHEDPQAANKTLVELGAQDGMGVLLEDTRGSHERDQFGAEEEERVQKYEMDDEAYAQRPDTVLAYKQRMKMGRFGEAKSAEVSSEAAADILPDSFREGARCEVDGGRRGTIRYAGQTDFASGPWVGIEYDEPVGKNDGSVAGRRYFTCAAKFGGFVKPDKVRVGDFAVQSIADEDEEM